VFPDDPNHPGFPDLHQCDPEPLQGSAFGPDPSVVKIDRRLMEGRFTVERLQCTHGCQMAADVVVIKARSDGVFQAFDETAYHLCHGHLLSVLLECEAGQKFMVIRLAH
jgi:hypothetical protein